jgi:hypothetical protein
VQKEGVYITKLLSQYYDNVIPAFYKVVEIHALQAKEGVIPELNMNYHYS